MPPAWRLFHVRRSTGKCLFFEVPLSNFCQIPSPRSSSLREFDQQADPDCPGQRHHQAAEPPLGDADEHRPKSKLRFITQRQRKQPLALSPPLPAMQTTTTKAISHLVRLLTIKRDHFYLSRRWDLLRRHPTQLLIPLPKVWQLPQRSYRFSQ